MPRYIRLRCDSCQMSAINGVACHETGCPRTRTHPYGVTENGNPVRLRRRKPKQPAATAGKDASR